MKWAWAGGRLHLADDGPLHEPTSLTMAPGFSRCAIALATASQAPTGTAAITRSRSLGGIARVGEIGVAEAEFARPVEVGGGGVPARRCSR